MLCSLLYLKKKSLLEILWVFVLKVSSAVTSELVFEELKKQKSFSLRVFFELLSVKKWKTGRVR